MNKYVVAWCSFFDNIIEQQVIEAPSAPEAVLKFMQVHMANQEWVEELAKLPHTSEEEWLDAIEEEVYATFNVMKL